MRGAKRKPGEVHQGEDVIGEARRVGVMLLDPQVGLVVQQAVEHVGRIAHADVHDLGVKWRVLVRNVGVERPPLGCSRISG